MRMVAITAAAVTQAQIHISQGFTISVSTYKVRRFVFPKSISVSTMLSSFDVFEDTFYAMHIRSFQCCLLVLINNCNASKYARNVMPCESDYRQNPIPIKGVIYYKQIVICIIKFNAITVMKCTFITFDFIIALDNSI